MSVLQPTKAPREHWIVTAIVVLPVLLSLVQAARIYLHMPLPRDPMIFQYTAWAVRHGDVLYRDIFDVNGPLITLMHIAVQALVGESAYGLRCVDLLAHTLVFTVVGATVVDAIDQDVTQRHTRGPRVIWSLITIVTLLSTYFAFNFWDTAQRDGLYFLCTLSSAALQTTSLARARPRWMLIAGVLSGITWLGKPTFIVFSLLQGLVIAWTEPSWRARFTTAGRWLTGCTLGALLIALVSTSIADLHAWFRLLLHDVPTVYRYLATVDAATQWRSLRGLCALLGIVGAAILLGLVRAQRLPSRALILGLLPLPAIVNIAIQSKGYFYHHEPLWSSVALQWTLILAHLWSAQRRTRSVRVAGVLLALMLAALTLIAVRTSMYFPLDAMLDEDHPAASDPTVLLQLFSQGDSQLFDELNAGQHLAATTEPTDRIQVFGMDPSVLFIAHRKSATPYIYSFDLVVDHTVAGARTSGATTAQLDAIEKFGQRRRNDFMRRLHGLPPARIVFPAHAVFLPGPPEHMFRQRMPEAAGWFSVNYKLESEFGSLRIYARKASD